MARKCFKPEEIISKLREVEVLLAKGGTVLEGCRQIGVRPDTANSQREEKITAHTTLVPLYPAYPLRCLWWWDHCGKSQRIDTATSTSTIAVTPCRSAAAPY